MTKQPQQEQPLWRRLLQWSFLRYVLVGASGAAVDFLVFLLSHQAMRGLCPPLPRGAANAAGMLVGAAYCFLLNRSWSFRSPGRFWHQAAGLRRPHDLQHLFVQLCHGAAHRAAGPAPAFVQNRRDGHDFSLELPHQPLSHLSEKTHRPPAGGLKPGRRKRRPKDVFFHELFVQNALDFPASFGYNKQSCKAKCFTPKRRVDHAREESGSCLSA